MGKVWKGRLAFARQERKKRLPAAFAFVDKVYCFVFMEYL